MTIDLDDTRLDLQQDKILRLSGALGVKVICSRGALWLTQNHDRRDVVLHAGDSFTIDRDGLALVSALEPSTVRLEAPMTVQSGTVQSEWSATMPAIWRKLMRGSAERLGASGRHATVEMRGY